MHALIVGFGSIGQRHAQSLRTLVPDVRITVLRARSGEDHVSRGFAASVASSLDQAISMRPDLAVVATPSHLHAQVSMRLLVEGIPFYLEKPAVTTTEDVARMRATLSGASSGLVTQMGCNLRFLPSLLRLRQSLADGAIGTVVRATLEVGQWLPDWRPGRDYRADYSAEAQGGGVVFDLIHEIDAARWLFGHFSDVRALAAHRSKLEIASEDTAWIALCGPGTPVVGIGMDYVSRRPYRRYRFTGERGNIVWDLGARSMMLEGAADEQCLCHEPDDFDIKATYITAMREFLDGIGGRCDTSQGLAEGLASAELAIRVRQAAGLPC